MLEASLDYLRCCHQPPTPAKGKNAVPLPPRGSRDSESARTVPPAGFWEGPRAHTLYIIP